MLLKKEFETNVSSAEIHKLMTNRKKKKDETLQEYIIIIGEIGSRANIETEEIIQYIIEDQSNKMILYEVSSFEDLKKKNKLYESIKSKTSEVKWKERMENVVKKTINRPQGQKIDIRRFSCSAKGHRLMHVQRHQTFQA